MLSITILDNICIISHFFRQQLPGSIYSFRKDFIPAHLWQRMLLLTTSHPAKFLLNDKQDSDLRCIIDKIKKEKDSGYVFSEDLQRIYLVELMHFINKMRQQNILI
jgi:hypothetical protein